MRKNIKRRFRLLSVLLLAAVCLLAAVPVQAWENDPESPAVSAAGGQEEDPAAVSAEDGQDDMPEDPAADPDGAGDTEPGDEEDAAVTPEITEEPAEEVPAEEEPAEAPEETVEEPAPEAEEPEDPEEVEEAGPDEELEEAPEEEETPSVSYRTHVQTYGWQKYVKDGAMSGTSGESKRLEGINIRVSGVKGLGVRYRTHVQTYGWQDWAYDGAMAGTTGESKRLEAIQIELTGEAAKKYDIWYCVHVQTYGWLNWAKNGAKCGTAGCAKRLEGILIFIQEKGAPAPESVAGAVSSFLDNEGGSAVGPNGYKVIYNTHVQTYGWQDWVGDGAPGGTSGQSKRLEGMHIRLQDQEAKGSIEYRTHVQAIGWQDWVKDGALAGTTGQSKRLEALQIRLTGAMAEKYDVWYRTHCQHFGWMGWAKNGEEAGTSGYAYRMEAVEIRLVPKGGKAPGSTKDAYKKGTVRDRWPQACAVLDQVGWDLRAAFDWSVMQYVYTPGDASLGPRYFADLGFRRHYGDCYVMAGCFSEMAKALGYDAHCVFGAVMSNSRPGETEIHGWVEINMNGELCVFDPSFQQGTGKNGYRIHYRDKGTWVYVNYRRVN